VIDRRVVRVMVGGIIGVAAFLVLFVLTGSLGEPDPKTGLVSGANTFMLGATLATLVAIAGYAAVERLQTGAIESIARQFDTRTVVLIPIAIAINVIVGKTASDVLRLPVYLDSIGTILVGVLAGPVAGALTGLASNFSWTFLLGWTPVGSPYAWPFAIVAAEIGLLAGVFGWAGVFRSRPATPIGRLAIGAGVAILALGALAAVGILPAFLKGTLIDVDLASVPPFFLAVSALIAAGVAVTAIGLVALLVLRRDLGVAWVVVAGATCGVVSAFVATPIATIMFGGVTGGGTDLLVAAFQQAGSTLQDAVLQQSTISDPIDKTLTFLVVFALLQALSRRFTARFPQGERALGPVEA
jgi:energy-coupling factor transport system substrate-specific component